MSRLGRSGRSATKSEWRQPVLSCTSEYPDPLSSDCSRPPPVDLTACAIKLTFGLAIIAKPKHCSMCFFLVR